jgi:peptidoglycan/LPS O-acetylase OafA/YrhL
MNFFVYYWLPHAMPVFSMGILTYYLLPMAPRSRLVANGFRVLAVLLVLYASWWPLPWISDLSQPVSRVLFASTASMLLALSLARAPAPWLVNRVTRHVGRVSFSVYLVHFGLYDPALRYFRAYHGGRFISVVLFMLVFPTIVAIAVGLSTLTYRYVEKPGIRCGERFLRRRPIPAVA